MPSPRTSPTPPPPATSAICTPVPVVRGGAAEPHRCRRRRLLGVGGLGGGAVLRATRHRLLRRRHYSRPAIPLDVALTGDAAPGRADPPGRPLQPRRRADPQTPRALLVQVSGPAGPCWTSPDGAITLPANAKVHHHRPARPRFRPTVPERGDVSSSSASPDRPGPSKQGRQLCSPRPPAAAGVGRARRCIRASWRRPTSTPCRRWSP